MSPRDFLEDSNPNMSMGENSPRDFLMDKEGSPRESFKESLALAGPRILKDFGDKAYNAVQSIPGYWEKAKTEIPGLANPVSQMRKHPLHASAQGFAGINEAINSLAQMPYNIARYGSERLNLLPQSVTDTIGYMTPPDTSQYINELFGQPKYEGEAALRGIGRNLPSLYGASRVAESIPHLTQRGATRTLRRARQLAEDRDIGTLNVNPELIEDARQFLPNTLPHRNALNAANSGNYNDLFRLQSDVGKNSSDYAKSFFSAAERSHGRAGLEARNRLLDAIHENLQSQGHHDISSLLRQGQNDYRRYMSFKPYRNALALTGMGAAGLSIPGNPLTHLLQKVLLQNT